MRWSNGIPLFSAALLTIATFDAFATDLTAQLSGAQEVPPVQTSASGTASFAVKDDMSISGGVKTEGIKGTMAHIHQGAAGTNGAVAIPLEQKGDSQWVVPNGAKLTPEQMTALKQGNLYVNVHSDAHKGGEIRAQLTE